MTATVLETLPNAMFKVAVDEKHTRSGTYRGKCGKILSVFCLATKCSSSFRHMTSNADE